MDKSKKYFFVKINKILSNKVDEQDELGLVFPFNFPWRYFTYDELFELFKILAYLPTVHCRAINF